MMAPSATAAAAPAGSLCSFVPAQRFAGIRSTLGKALYWHHRLFNRRRLEGDVIEHIEDQPIVVLQGVLNPKLMRTGAFFASVLAREPSLRDAEVLDLGTGSGVCAVIAAQRARKVVAVDLNPAAVRCAQINALIAGLGDRIEALEGDLFAPVKGRRFDLVLFNPPFLVGAPRDAADLAWRSTDVAERFAAELREHLTRAGRALLLLSTFGDADAFLRPLSREGFQAAVLAERRFFNEQLVLFEVRLP